MLAAGYRVVFVTGAGISVASGITPYRGTPGAVWAQYLLDWGTRAAFLRDPLVWWNQFWLRTHEKPEFLSARPNPAHWAIARLAQRCDVRVITQNIDLLHQRAGLPDDRVIQVHGTLGRYKCTWRRCRYAVRTTVTAVDLDALAAPATSLAAGNLSLLRVPTCPACASPLMPASLFFDEDYTSHACFQIARAGDWVHASDAVVFVGTSFSVGVTDTVLQAARRRRCALFSVNLPGAKPPAPDVNLIAGAAEVVLSDIERLVSQVSIAYHRRQYDSASS